MLRVEDDKLESWNAKLEHRASQLRERRRKLDDDSAACTKLEASLLQLIKESEGTQRLLREKELYLANRREAIVKRREETKSLLRSQQENARSREEADELVNMRIDDEWRRVEAEINDLEVLHANERELLEEQIDNLEALQGRLKESNKHMLARQAQLKAKQADLGKHEELLRGRTQALLGSLEKELQWRKDHLNRKL